MSVPVLRAVLENRASSEGTRLRVLSRALGRPSLSEVVYAAVSTLPLARSLPLLEGAVDALDGDRLARALFVQLTPPALAPGLGLVLDLVGESAFRGAFLERCPLLDAPGALDALALLVPRSPSLALRAAGTLLGALDAASPLDSDAAALLVSLVALDLDQEELDDVLGYLEWSLDDLLLGGEVVSPGAAALLVESDHPGLRALALAAPFDEGRFCRVARYATAELLEQTADLPGLTLGAVRAVLARLEVLGPGEAFEAAGAYLDRALPRLEADGDVVLALALGFDALWDDGEASLGLVSFLAGGWASLPPLPVLDRVPRPVLVSAGQVLAHQDFDGLLDLRSRSALSLVGALPGLLPAWTAQRRSRWSVQLGEAVRSVLDAGLGGDVRAWEVALTLAENFEGSLDDLVRAARELASPR